MKFNLRFSGAISLSLLMVACTSAPNLGGLRQVQTLQRNNRVALQQQQRLATLKPVDKTETDSPLVQSHFKQVEAIRRAGARIYQQRDTPEQQARVQAQDYSFKLNDGFHIQGTADCCSGGLSPERPNAPTFLIQDDFSEVSDINFANLVNDPSGWTEWGTNYYPTPTGVTLWNPGPGQGPRDNPGEYIFDRSRLLESGIYQNVPLTDAEGVRTFKPGDRLVAKFTTSPTFDHEDSDTTIYLRFDDPDETIAVSSTIRSVGSKHQELYVDVEIPECATSVTVNLLGYLGENETSSVTFEKVSLEQVPAEYYTSNNLLTQNFDSGVTNDFGDNNPDVADQFGDYNFFLVDDYPVNPGDKAITVANEASSTAPGGLIQRVDLTGVNPGDFLTAELYAAATFSDPASEAYLKMVFYDANDQALGDVSSEVINRQHYRWLMIDRAVVPAGAAYVHLVPTITLGASETSSLLMDELKLHHVSQSGATPPAPQDPAATCHDIVLQDPTDNSQYPLGGWIVLRANPTFAQNGLTVRFVDQDSNVIGTGTREPWGTFAYTWKTAALGSHQITAQAVDANGNVLATSSAHAIQVTANQIDLTGPASGTDSVAFLPHTQNLTANIQLADGLTSGDVVVKFRENGTEIGTATDQGGGSYSYTWNATLNTEAGVRQITATLEDLSGNILATSASAQLTFRKQVDIVFIFDGGGSLAGYVQSVKENLLNFVDTLEDYHIDANFALGASATRNSGHPHNDDADATTRVQDLSPDAFATRSNIVNFPNIGGTSQDTYSSLVELAGDPFLGANEPDLLTRRTLSDGSKVPLVEILVTDHHPEQQRGQFTGFANADGEDREAAVAAYLAGLEKVHVYAICETSSFDEYDQIKDATAGGLSNIGNPEDMAANLQSFAAYIRDTL